MRRVAFKRRGSCSFEGLETRRMMSSVQGIMPAELLEKVHQNLLSVAQDVSRGQANKFVEQKNARLSHSGAIQTYIRTDGEIDLLVSQLGSIGIGADATDPSMKIVQAWVKPSMMDDVAALSSVAHMDLPTYAVTNVVTSAGDGILQADKVRNNFAALGIDGSGIKVGVISDGANHRNNVGAELPLVTVDPTRPGNGDEGTAMLEIVHDLAPGAQLYFSGPSTSVDMVGSINYLVAQGCDVIIDDLSFFGEHFFSDTSVANAAQNAVNGGVSYFTSSGNYSSEAHYQGMYVQGNSAYDGGVLHRFGVAGQDVNEVNIPNGSRFRAFLQWSDGWGTSANNYDLFLFNGDTFAQLDSSTTVQNGNDLPLEWVDWTNNTGSTVHGQLWVNRKTGAATRELELFTLGNSTLQFETQGDALIGQQAVAAVNSIATCNAASPTSVTSYSSRGGSTIYSNFTTQTKSVRQTLDGTAIDGVQTMVGQNGWFSNPFYGTSAASPHAGAIAALVLDANPSLTPAQVSQIMADTATDLGAVGYDTSSGAGRYNVLDAVYKAFTPATPNMAAGSDSGVSNSDDITNAVTPSFSGAAPAGAYVELLVDGTVRGSTQLAANATNWSMIPNSAMTNGFHNVSVRMGASNSTPVANRAVSAPLGVTIDTIAPELPVNDFVFDAPQQYLSFDFNEDLSSVVSLGSLGLFNNSTSTSVPQANLSFNYEGGINIVTIGLPGYTYGALPDGEYSATFTGITDAAGNAMAAHNFQFFFLNGDANRDMQVSGADFNVLATHFGGSNKVFTQGDFTYDGQVNSADFNLLATKFGTSLTSQGARGSSAPAGGWSGGGSSGLFGETGITSESESADLLA